MFKLNVSDLVTFPVKGSLTDEEGRAVPFDFTLTARRLKSAELDAVIEDKEQKTSTFLLTVVTGWKGVHGPDGQPMDFSTAALEQLFGVAGVPNISYIAYLQAVGAKGKEKN